MGLMSTPADWVTEPGRWRSTLLTLILKAAAVLGFLVYLPSVVAAIRDGSIGLVMLDTVVLGVVVALHRTSRLPFVWRASIFCLVCYALSLGLLVAVGPISQIYLFGFSILTAMLLGLRSGIAASVLSAASLLAIGLLGWAAPSMVAATWNNDLAGWVVITINFALVNIVLTLSVGTVINALDLALEREVAARASLEHERSLLRTLIDALPDIVFTKDVQGRYMNGNAAMLARLGLTQEGQLAGKMDVELFPADLAARYQEDDRAVFAGQPLLNQEEPGLGPGGAAAWHLTIKVPLRDATGRTVGLLGIARDISARKLLEDQLRQSQKMDAVGRLAGGVAHDFNNLLTVIAGYSEFVLVTPGIDDDVRESVEAIREAGERAAALTRQLLIFSRQTVLQPEVLDLNAIVGDTGKMLRRLIGEDIELTIVPGENLSHIKVDPGQLNQILLNLSVNARDAMPTGGRLTIETANVMLSDDYGATHLDCDMGPHVMLAVTDTGSGMPPEVLTRIFEPFFTTKAAGKGTGLGLAVVFGIVQQSGGGIHVYSEPGHGTTFKMYFPAVQQALTHRMVQTDIGELRGHETILLVEDEETVRALASTSLQALGYRVLVAIDGEDAVRVASAHPEHIDLLLTDVVMPKRSGPAVAADMKTRMPGIKLLFMSGYTDDAVVRHGLLEAEVSFIQKPYTPLLLARKVRQVLDEEGTRNAG